MELDSYWYRLDQARCFKHLNFPIKIDTSKFPSGIVNAEKKHWGIIPIDLDDYTIQLFDELEIIVEQSRLFHMAPGIIYTPHSDYEKLNKDVAALNFVWGGKDSKMSWYELQQEKYPIKHFDSHGSPVSYYKKEDLNLVNSTRVSSCCLVNVGAIHTVDNIGVETRTCLSLRLKDKKGDLLSWDEAEYKFKKFETDNPIYNRPLIG